ncbi:MAG: response regulator [Kiritimatiellae bacterium]|nr:response regulator [Kiritimatiellia bacterium]
MATILIVDDNESLRGFLCRIVEKAGHRAVTARNGIEAIECVERESVELVISDIFMPESDGVELIRNLKKLRTGIKIFAVSGGGKFGDMDALQAARLCGALRIFIKPFSTDDMISAIREAVGDPAEPPNPHAS